MDTAPTSAKPAGADKEAPLAVKGSGSGKGKGSGGNNMARLFTLLMRMRQECAHPFLVLGKVD